MTDTQNGSHLDIMASINLALGRLNKHIDEQARRWERNAKKASAPVLGKVAYSGQANAGGFAILLNQGGHLIDGPDQGNIWFIRRITICGPDPSATVTGSAFVFVSAMDYSGTVTSIAGMGSMDLQDFTNTIPNVSFYGRGEMALRFNESITIAVQGVPANQVIVGSYAFEQFEEGAFRQDWAL